MFLYSALEKRVITPFGLQSRLGDKLLEIGGRHVHRRQICVSVHGSGNRVEERVSFV